MITQTDYDYGSGSPGAALRTTTNAYMALSGPNASSYLANNLLSLPYTVQIKDGSGTQAAYTHYGYDESSLQSSGVTEQKTTGLSYPGNQTSVHRWLNGNSTGTGSCPAVTGGYLITNSVYYDTGELQKSTDPCSDSTTYGYSSAYYGAYPTTVTNALGQITTYGYDFNSGSVTSIQDPNLQKTTKTYDPMDRLTSINYPDTGSTTYCYTDGVPANCPSGDAGGYPYAVVMTKAITSAPLYEVNTAVVDGLARLSQTQLNSDPDGTTYALTTYDPLGRTSQVYNSTRCASITSNCDNESTWGYTTTNYDPLNRITSVVEQDGGVEKITYDQTNPHSTGLCTTFTDEASESRQSCVDGLGRTSGVWEDPTGLNYETDYHYDALNNLFSVLQTGGAAPTSWRVREFAYDSLSRLTGAYNPESGLIFYNYDANGNVATKATPLGNSSYVAPTPGSGSLSIDGTEQESGTTWDSGTVSITVNGFTVSASFGEGSTGSAIASSLASSLNNSVPSPVYAAVSGSTLTIVSLNSNYSWISSVTDNSGFNPPSFSVSPTSGTLSGGTSGTATSTVTTNFRGAETGSGGGVVFSIAP